MADARDDAFEAAAQRLADDGTVDPGLADSIDAREFAALRDIARIAGAHHEGHRRASTHDDAAPEPRAGDALFVWGMLRATAKVGEGSFGEVWRAYDASLDREVALKLRRVGDAASSGALDATHDPALRRWLEEARALARVRHPNVLTIHGAAEHEGRVGLWTELVDGEDLEQRLARTGPLPAREVARLGADLCAALGAVHRAGLVHGDVKAANVMVEHAASDGAPGRLLLMDFGAATLPARTGYTAGTPLAMAPEVLAGAPPSVASDVYSAGVLLHRLLTGRFPVESDSLEGLRAAHRVRANAPLRVNAAHAPARLLRAIGAALHPDPAQRPASVTALARELQAVLRPGRALLAPIAACVLIASAAITVWWWNTQRPSDTRFRSLTELPGPLLPGGLTIADTLVGGAKTDELGWQMACVGDVNGDGCDDFVAASVRATRTESDQGILALYLGSRSGRFSAPVWHLLGPERGSQFPRAMRAFADVNGDGRPELLLGLYAYRDSDHQPVGAAELHLSTPAGFDSLPAWRVMGDTPGGGFADFDGLCDAGDVDGDGYEDVLVTAWTASQGAPNTGTAYLYRGRPGGISPAPAWVYTSPLANGTLGWQPLSAGDLNGDGCSDVALGSSLADGASPQAGQLAIFLGSRHGLPSRPSMRLLGTHFNGRFGHHSGGVGDITGDGRGELLVTEPGMSGSEIRTGRAIVYRGAAGGVDPRPIWSGAGHGSLARFSERFLPVGDMNGDGVPDAMISADDYRQRAGARTGEITLVFFRRGDPAHPYFWHIAPPDVNTEVFGWGIGSAGDFNGDGLADVLIGWPNFGDDRGAVLLVLGRRQPLP